MIKIRNKSYRSNKMLTIKSTNEGLLHRRGFFTRAPDLSRQSLDWPDAPARGSFLSWLKKFHINDRLILECFHKLEVGALMLLVGSVFLVPDKQVLLPFFQILLVIVLGMGYYRTYLFKRLNANLQAIVKKTSGEFIDGSAALAVPPQARFVYDHQDCHVLSTIDKYFRLVLEYHCYFGKEREFRIEKTIKRGKVRIAAFGQDKELFEKILMNPHTKKSLDVLLDNFSYLHYGKDGVMHVGEPFDGKLTEMDTVLPALDAMSTIGRALKLDG